MEAGQKQSSWHRRDSKMEYDRQKIVSMKKWLTEEKTTLSRQHSHSEE